MAVITREQDGFSLLGSIVDETIRIASCRFQTRDWFVYVKPGL